MTENHNTCVDIVTEIIKNAGGRISFEEFDKAYRDYPGFKPIVTFCGMSDPTTLEHNNGVFSCALARSRGLIDSDGHNYFLTTTEPSSGRLMIPMASEEACRKATKQDYPGVGEQSFCINTSTGQIFK